MINFSKKSSVVVMLSRKGVDHFVRSLDEGLLCWYVECIFAHEVGNCELYTVSIDGAFGLPVK